MYYTIINYYILTDTDVKTIKKWMIDKDLKQTDVSSLLCKSKTYFNICLEHKKLPYDLVNFMIGKNFNFRKLKHKVPVIYYKLDEDDSRMIMRQKERLKLRYIDIVKPTHFSQIFLKDMFAGERTFNDERKKVLEKVGFNFDEFELIYKDSDDPIWCCEF